MNTGVHYFQMGKQLISVIKMSQTKSLPELAVETRPTASCGRCHKTENMAENDGKIYDRSDWCVEGRENGGRYCLKIMYQNILEFTRVFLIGLSDLSFLLGMAGN